MKIKSANLYSLMYFEKSVLEILTVGQIEITVIP